MYKLNNQSTDMKTSMGEYGIPVDACGWHKLQIKRFHDWTNSVARDPWMYTVDSLVQLSCVGCELSTQHLPYIGLGIETKVRVRTRRDAACKPGAEACCIDDLYINITDIVHETPNLIVMPKKYNVRMCRGTCDNVHSASDIRGGLVNAASIAKKDEHMMLCCAPTKYESLSTLVSVDHNDVSERIIEDIIVTECGCV